MRLISRLITAAAALAMVTLGLAPAAQAASPNVFTVADGSSYEYYKDCQVVAPYACGTNATSMYILISDTYPGKGYPITLGYQLEPITATAGADYTGTTGTVTIPAGTYQAQLLIPIVNDGAAEGSETFRVRLTSSSSGGTFTDTGIGTILDEGQIPLDCDLSKPNVATTSLACTNRPGTQNWQLVVDCFEGAWGYRRAYGPAVTGSGTSTAVCSVNEYDGAAFQVLP
ncbi:Calx-beta domain-containing protein [Longispora sp. K20-0274]|uniref:Calx-beta domain-containing protein n=1 Tax=Longispora sp. K20-0274 TaxID=3088255 RepID=UPI00399BF57E